MPIKPLPYIDKHGYQYSPEVQAEIDAAIRKKAAEMSEEKKPYQKPELRRLQPEDVPAEAKDAFDKALAQAAQTAHPKDRTAEYWDVRDYTQFFTEIIVFRMNQMSLGENTQEHYWAAQDGNVALRNKLQAAYVSAIQKARIQNKKDAALPETWMFGAAAYELITEQGMKLEAVLEMSGAKLAQLAAEQGELFRKKAEQEGETAYMIKKKSREK